MLPSGTLRHGASGGTNSPSTGTRAAFSGFFSQSRTSLRTSFSATPTAGPASVNFTAPSCMPSPRRTAVGRSGAFSSAAAHARP